MIHDESSLWAVRWAVRCARKVWQHVVVRYAYSLPGELMLGFLYSAVMLLYVDNVLKVADS